MPRREIRITGYGGQGIILTGYILGKAAAIYDDLHSTMTQSFGPEARGSACSAALVISDTPIAYPYLHETDYLVALSREGYEKYHAEMKREGSILVHDQDLVDPRNLPDTISTYGVPATRIAEELGKRIVQNIVVVGFTIAATEIVSKEAARQAVESSVPKGLVELNLTAFEKGYEFFQQSRGSGDRGRDHGDSNVPGSSESRVPSPSR
jgi:2-oxoglutarate ferredoxin oxidoreductase subunit gamma